ncbi:phosphatidylserine decarboxylase [Apostasia shenzhenica]|uniref:phosphatidylserine decarboxylase n=1 Tax=Apostasia shenzhenica TaxID=1088818 RepID=A0A2I0B8M8_9ASPA|nr:phosphatidylserine decarboxylase [Apostasia shenzhenica]
MFTCLMADLEEAALPLEEYATLQDFFIRSLKDGSRPNDPDPNCLVSPVDGTVLRFGELKGPGAMIEQVKGFSYSAYSLLGATTSLLEVVDVHAVEEFSENCLAEEQQKRSWWRISMASPKVRHPGSACPRRGVFYCVLYLWPGDYHRVHSPVDWQVLLRRHFSGHLFPLNERATRSIRNLHIENERVVLEGQWREGFMAMVAIGATCVGSIKLFIEPELKTNRPKKHLLHADPQDVKIYEPEGIGLMLKKGEEVAAFNMGSTVVLVFQAPISGPREGAALSQFSFCIRNGDRVRAGEAIGRWSVS